MHICKKVEVEILSEAAVLTQLWAATIHKVFSKKLRTHFLVSELKAVPDTWYIIVYVSLDEMCHSFKQRKT